MNSHLSEAFRNFAERECKETSPLYYSLSHSIAQDNDVLEIAGQAQEGQPVPNLFFAAVHYFLVSDSSHPLAVFYASCTTEVETYSDAWPEFKDFVHSHHQKIVSLLQSRFVQTNEVRRCAFLFPAFLFAASHFKPQPLALVEIGTSAGLNLLWDQYQYSYDDSTTYGATLSPVLIHSAFRGNRPSILSEPVPEISHRIGVDLNVIDLSHPDEVAWLRALVWPEHHERRDLMDAALKKRSEMQPDLDLRTGDGFAMLEEIAEEIPTESLLCVYHTHVANQISKTKQEAFLSSIERLGKQRDIVHLFNNIAQPHLHLTAYRDGQLLDLPLAKTDGHARWIEWLQNHAVQSHHSDDSSNSTKGVVYMNEMTSFIAKMMALYLLVTGIGFFLSKEFYLRMLNDAESEHPISINLSGMVHFFIGMAIILNHFLWNTHLEIAVSLIGMAFLLKGSLLIMFPGTILKSNQFSMKILPLSGIGFIAVGLYLIWALYV